MVNLFVVLGFVVSVDYLVSVFIVCSLLEGWMLVFFYIGFGIVDVCDVVDLYWCVLMVL